MAGEKLKTDKEFIRVDAWEPTEEDDIVGFDGKVMIIPFDKVFPNAPYERVLNEFLIKKISYSDYLEHYTHYINYFIKFYDDKNELLLSYLKIKYMIINREIKLDMKTFIQLLYTVLLTDSLRANITRMVEDNYYLRVNEKKKNKTKYPEFLEFNDYHAKIMMEISIAMKLMLPVLMHYTVTNNLLKVTEYKEYPLYPFYAPLFEYFGGEVNIYNKLYEKVKISVNNDYRDNSTLWGQREIKGDDPVIRIDRLLKKDIISECMPRYVFHKSSIAFNHVILRQQLAFANKEKYQYNHVRLTNEKDGEGLSGLDKLEMNTAKIDESLVILANVNTRNVIERVRKSMHFEILKEEVDYYKDNTAITKFQVNMVFYYYAKIFGGYRDLQLLKRQQYMKLLVMLKKRLQYQGMVYLPQILTANIPQNKPRLIQNQKFLNKISNSATYQSIIQDKFYTLEEMDKSTLILGMLSTILNSSFSVVDYERQDKLGEKLEINVPDILSDEFLSFLNQI